MKNIYRNRIHIALIFVALILIGIATLFFMGTVSATTAHADSEAEKGIHFEVEKNPIEAVYVSAEKTEAMRGEYIALSAKVFPENASLTVNDTSFFIINGNGYAQVDGNHVIIDDLAPIGSRIMIMAKVDGVESDNAISLIVKKTPVEGIEFLTDESEIVSGSSYLLEANVTPADATDKGVRYSVEFGAQYVNVSYSGVLTFNNIAQPEEDYLVAIKATSVDNPAVYSIKSLRVVAPSFETVLANKELIGVEQQRTYSFNAENEPYFSIFKDKAVYYSIDVESDIATIDLRGLLYIKPDAPIGTHIVVSLDTNDGTHYSQELEIIPVYATSFTPVLLSAPTKIWNEAPYYLPGDILSFDVRSFSPLNVSDFNKTCELRINDSSIASVAADKVVINNKILSTNPHLVISVVSVPNGLSETFEIDIYIAPTTVSLTEKVSEVQENTIYNISELVNCIISPNNAMYMTVEYHIETSSFGVATIRNGQIIIHDSLPAGNIMFGLYAVVDGIRTNTIWFNVYKPTTSLAISANTYEPISSAYTGEKVFLYSTVSKTASTNSPAFSITMGANLLDGGIQYVGALSDGRSKWQFILKKNLANLNGITPIVISAKQDNVSSNKLTFDIHIPDEGLSVIETTVSRGATHRIAFTHTANATDKTFEWFIETSGVNKVVGSNDEFFVPKNFSAGTQITIKYRSCDTAFFGNNGAWKKAIFTVKEIENKKENSVFDNGLKRTGFNFVFGKEGNYTIGKNGSMPQLEVGKSTRIDLVYSNASIAEYGMKIKSKEFIRVGDYADIIDYGDDWVEIKAKATAVANSEIQISIDISDGEKSYPIQAATLYTFRKLDGKLEFNTVTQNKTNITSYINRASSTFDFNANDGYYALKFEMLNQGGFKLDNYGTLEVTSYTACKEQSITYSYQQTYNGELLPTYKETSTINLRTVTLNNNGGTVQPSYYVALKNMSSIKAVASVPSKANYVFNGYSSYIDKNGNVLRDLSSTSSLTASWVKVKYTYKSTTNKTIIDDNVYSYKEWIYPSFDIATLKSLGYTKIKITVKYDCREINDGYQDIRLFSGSDSNRIGDITEEHGKGHKDTSWWSHTLNYEISLSSFATNTASFYIGWGAHGAFEDNWKLGTRTISVEALK